MQSILAPLLPLVLSLGRIHTHHTSDNGNLHPTPDHPLSPLASDITRNYPDLVAYAQAQNALRSSVPLVAPDFELKLLSDAAEEVKHLDVGDDNQRERLCAILKATQAIIKQHSALPTTIHPDIDTNTLKDLAAQFEVTFLEYASLSSSPTWSKYCMAALLGKDTLIKLLPFLSEGFFDRYIYQMLRAAAVIGDFGAFRAVATHSRIPLERLQYFIEEDVIFSGNLKFVEQIADFIPSFISQVPLLLAKAISLNHRSLFEYLYEETTRQQFNVWGLQGEIKWAFEAIAKRGWVDVFKQLYSKHPQCLDIKGCLVEAAAHGHINLLNYILFQNADLAEEAKSHLSAAFEAAVGNGTITAVDFFLGNNENGHPIIPNISLSRPSPDMLRIVSQSGRWVGIEHLMQLKNKGDVRFVNFKLAGDASEAVDAACRYGNLPVLKQLLKKDSQGQLVFNVDTKDVLQTSLLHACQHGYLPIVQEFLKYSDVDPAKDDNHALITACRRGHHLVVRELLRDGRVNAAARDGEPLTAACREGHLLIVRELLQQRNGQYIYPVDPAANRDAALIAACGVGHLLIVRELLQHERVNSGARDGEPLIAACNGGHLMIVRELLQKDNQGIYIHNVDPGARNGQCLSDARQYERFKVVQFLLQEISNAHAVATHGHLGIQAASE